MMFLVIPIERPVVLYIVEYPSKAVNLRRLASTTAFHSSTPPSAEGVPGND
jgi:hypothetical protein